MFMPSAEAVAAVRDWLMESGIASHRIIHSDNKSWLAFDATADEVEALLNAEYHNYEHVSGDRVVVGCEE